MAVYLQVFLTRGESESGWSAIHPNFFGERTPVPTEWETEWSRNPVRRRVEEKHPRRLLEIEPFRRQSI